MVKKNNNKLNLRRQKFVWEYVIDMNASAAYIRAGYKVKNSEVARKAASRLLTNVDVQQFIFTLNQKIVRRTEIEACAVLRELELIAFSDICDCFELLNKNLKLKDISNIPPHASRAIKYLYKSKYGFAIKLHDKDRALELLGKHFGLFNNKDYHSAKVSENPYSSSLSETELKEKVEALEKILMIDKHINKNDNSN